MSKRRRDSENDSDDSNEKPSKRESSVDNDSPMNMRDEDADDMGGEPSTSAPPPSVPVKYEMNPDHLRIYYERLFPFTEMYRWLSYCNDPNSKSDLVDKTYFLRREFCFITKDEAFVRYQCFKDRDAFRKAWTKFCPLRVEIGPVYNEPPSMKDAISNFHPQQKELVFDIDMTDYDEVRTCCQDKAICNECWPLMNCAIRVLSDAIEEDFGFDRLLWVFSGRRGVHLWVGDEAARALGDEARYSIGQYLTVHMGSQQGKVKMNLDKYNTHHSINRALATCEPYFEKLCQSQGWLDTEEGIDKMLNFFPLGWERLDKIRDSLIRDLDISGTGNSLERWHKLRKKAREEKSKGGAHGARAIRRCLDEIVLYYVYPRLDINVTRKLNHLLKSPFVVHPGTGNVCVPIPTKYKGKWVVDQFDPLDQPKVERLHDEINHNNSGKAGASDLQRTSLNKYVKFFVEHFVSKLERDVRESRRQAATADMTF